MINKEAINMEELEKIVAGTIDESARLIIPLADAGHGAFIKNNYPERNDFVDIEKMQEFFASKGYKFIPGFGEQQNIFIGPDNLKYGNDYIIYLLESGQL